MDLSAEETKLLTKVREVGNYFVPSQEVRMVQRLIEAGKLRRVDRYHVEAVGK